MSGYRSWRKPAAMAVLTGVFVFLLFYGVKATLFETMAIERTGETSAEGSPEAGVPPSSTRILQGEEATLLQDLKRRQATLEKEEKALQVKKEDLKALQAELDQKMTQLTQLREELNKLLAKKKAQDETKLLHLVKLYEAMRSEEAAAVLTTMNDQIAVDLLTHMNSKKAGKILALIPTQRANELSEKLVNRE